MPNEPNRRIWPIYGLNCVLRILEALEVVIIKFSYKINPSIFIQTYGFKAKCHSFG